VRGGGEVDVYRQIGVKLRGVYSVVLEQVKWVFAMGGVD
jgi:hypothetical protein